MRASACIPAAFAASVLFTGLVASASAYPVSTPLDAGAGRSVDSSVVSTASPNLWTASDSSQQSNSTVPADCCALLGVMSEQPETLTVSLTGTYTEGGDGHCYSGYKCKPPPPPVPLPAAAWLLASGFVGFVALGRRRRPPGAGSA